MQKNKPIISIIIVHYHVKKELFACLRSVYQSGLEIPFEIIVVDHDEKPTIEKHLLHTFLQVHYMTNRNTGWGGGTNVGAKQAKGKYLFFLNPDCIVLPGAIGILYHFLQNQPKAAIVSTLLLHENHKPFRLQATDTLTPLRAIVSYSFLNTWFPNNFISRKFFLLDWDRKDTHRVAVAPLSSALVRKDIFQKAGGFDESFFLYFEEYDLAKRIAKLGYESFLVPDAKVIHLWGRSTKRKTDASDALKRSRFLYFKKYYGLFIAYCVEACLRIRKVW